MTTLKKLQQEAQQKFIVLLPPLEPAYPPCSSLEKEFVANMTEAMRIPFLKLSDSVVKKAYIEGRKELLSELKKS